MRVIGAARLKACNCFAVLARCFVSAERNFVTTVTCGGLRNSLKPVIPVKVVDASRVPSTRVVNSLAGSSINIANASWRSSQQEEAVENYTPRPTGKVQLAVNRLWFAGKVRHAVCALVCALMLSAVSLRAFAQAQPNHPTLRTIGEVRKLSNVEARNAYPVQLEGIATYSDPEWGLLFLADATGAIYVNIHGMSSQFPAGSHLRVDAVTGPGDVGTVLAQPSIHVLGQGTLPTPEHRSVSDLNALSADSHFIETRGVLWACDQSWKRICFRITDGKASALVVVPAHSSAAAQKLVGATVRIHGVSGLHLDPNGKPLSALIFVNRFEDIEVEGGAAQNQNALAVIVNKSNPLNNLSLTDLSEILLGKRTFWRGSQNIVVLLPNGG